jgi:3-oxoadipate enol-lactonase
MTNFITPDGCRLYYETHGFGSNLPFLIFINGTAQTTLNWLPTAKRLTSRYRIVLYDHRCQGESDISATAPGLKVHARDLVALMDHLGIERSYLAGLSHGGRIALEVATTTPRRADKLMCISTSVGHSPRRQAMVSSWIKVLQAGGVAALGWAMIPFIFGEKFLNNHHRYLDGAIQLLADRNRPEALLAYLSAVLTDPIPKAETLQCTSLFLSGADDPIAPVNRVIQTARLYGGSHDTIEEVGHSIPVEDPSSFEKRLREFFVP